MIRKCVINEKRGMGDQPPKVDHMDRGAYKLKVVLPNLVPISFTSMLIISFLACFMFMLGFLLGIFVGCD